MWQQHNKRVLIDYWRCVKNQDLIFRFLPGVYLRDYLNFNLKLQLWRITHNPRGHNLKLSRVTNCATITCIYIAVQWPVRCDRQHSSRMQLGLRELCSKSSSLFYSEFPQKLYHYAHYYSQLFSLFLTLLSYFYSFSLVLQSKCATILCSGLYYIKCICNSLPIQKQHCCKKNARPVQQN